MEFNTKYGEKNTKNRNREMKGPFLYTLSVAPPSVQETSRVGKLYSID